MRYVLLVLVVSACANCGGDGNHADAAIDMAIGDGPCGVDDYFTGEVVDWDETDTNFCGVFNAKMTVRGDATRTDMTNPNGRFELCLPRTPMTLVDVTPPTGPSQCVSSGLYQISGVAVAYDSVIKTGKPFSARMLTMGRLAQFFPGYNAANATVFVHVEGTTHPVTSSATHDAPLVFDGTNGTWAAGDTGVNIVFPNTDPSGGMTTIAVTGGTAIGTGAVPVTAGQFTYVTIVGN